MCIIEWYFDASSSFFIAVLKLVCAYIVLPDSLLYFREEPLRLTVHSMKDLELDFSISLLTLPSQESRNDDPTEDFDFIVPYQVVGEFPIQFIFTNKATVANVTELGIGSMSLNSFNPDVYYNCSCSSHSSVTGILFDWKVQEKWTKSFLAFIDPSIFDSFFAHFFLFTFQEFDHAFERTPLSVSLTVAGFQLILYWSNLMSTDLVVIPLPKTLDS